MRAEELIQQVAALPPQERSRFEHLFQEMGKGACVRETAPPTTERPDFSKRLRRIYGDKVVPDSQQVIDEGRGDR